MNSSLSLIKEDLMRHKVEVTLPGEKSKKHLFLIIIKAKTKLEVDYRATFGNAISLLHVKIAKKIFGTDETENEYGVFLDNDLKMVFSFNTLFADYDRNKKEVVYRDLDSILVNAINQIDIKNTFDEAFTQEKVATKGPVGILKYSLVEKE